jgi:uncharacterized protein Veg
MTMSGSITISPSPSTDIEYIPVDSLASESPIILSLPASSGIADGKVIHIKDEGGNATGNQIQINANSGDKIEGGSSYSISTNYGSVTIVKSSTTPANGPWFIISKVV